MSVGLLPHGVFESRKVRRKRFEQQEDMYRRISETHRFFGHLSLAQDGGLDVEVREMYHPNRLVGTLATLVVIFLNVRVLIYDNVAFFRQDKRFATDKLNLSEIILKYMGFPSYFKAEEMVAIFELTVLCLLAVLVCSYALQGIAGGRSFRRWLAVARLFREVLPELKYFSAMRCLSHVLPYMVTRELKSMVWHWEDRRASGEAKSRLWVELVGFTLGRIVIFIFGFDAFIVKFRMVAANAYLISFPCFLKILLFLNQVLGVVQLERFTMLRLHQFVFGGEDNKISPGEERVLVAWTTRLFERVWTDRSAGFLRAFAVSVTFAAEDFQRLMLNEKVVEIPEHRILHTGTWPNSRRQPSRLTTVTQPVRMAPKALPSDAAQSQEPVQDAANPVEPAQDKPAQAPQSIVEGHTRKLRHFWENELLGKSRTLIGNTSFRLNLTQAKVQLPAPLVVQQVHESLL